MAWKNKWKFFERFWICKRIDAKAAEVIQRSMISLSV